VIFLVSNCISAFCHFYIYACLLRAIGKYDKVKFSLAVSPGQPLFKLRWTQEATSSTPTLSISEISVKGSGSDKDTCQLYQKIEFDKDG